MMKGGKMKRGQEKDGKHTCVRLGSKKQKRGKGGSNSESGSVSDNMESSREEERIYFT